MKILIVTHYFKPHIGGIEIIAYNQAKELIEKGHQVTIITSKFQREKTIEHSEGIRIVRVPAWNLFENKFAVPYPIFSPWLILKINREVKDHDIIHAHGALYQGSFFSAFFAKMHKKSFLLTEHVGFVMYKSFVINMVEKLAFHIVGLYIIRASYATIVYNTHVSTLIKQYKKEVLYLPNGVDFKLFNKPTAQEKQAIRERYHMLPDKFIVLFVGRFVPKKGFDILYNAKDPAYVLVFVGGGGSIPEYIQSDSSVRIMEPLPQEELALLYKASDAFILPSYGEGFPLAIQEAMATGLPIITSKHNNLDQILDSPLITYVDITETDIKYAIKKIQSSKTLQKEMGEYSSTIAREHYSWERNATKLLEVYAKGISSIH
ncbi:glycosyl transferase [Ktedonobacteria bacterium brp13]|nr:glycosyl transferase [Ktedonobacteria bacterium brp13]